MGQEAPSASRGHRLTLAQAGERYRRHLATAGKPKSGVKRKRSTLNAVESTFRVWLDPRLGDRSLDAVTPSMVRELMNAMQKAGVGPKSIRNYLGTLSALYRFAMHPQRKWTSTNPVDAIELPALEQNAGIRYLTPQDARALAGAAVEGEHCALDRALYLTAAMTGLRQGELLALRWQDVDWSAQRIRVRRSHVLGQFDTPKSRRGLRSVPMGAEVVGALDTWSQETAWSGSDDLVFVEPMSGEVLRRGALMRRYKRALKAAQLDAAHRFHDLRHCFGTAMAAAGVPIRTLQEWMGHRDIQTTMIYADYAPNAHEVEMVDQGFSQGSIRGPNVSEPHMV